MKHLLSILLIFISMSIHAQTDTIQIDSSLVIVDSLNMDSLILDSLAIDSLNINDKKEKKEKKKGLIYRFRDKRYPNPTRAAIFSLLIPGAGQFYNKKYWKMPIVYGALGGLTYLAIVQNDEYQLYRREYAFMVDDDPLTISRFEGRATAQTLKSIRDVADKRRQNAVVGIVAVWLLNSVDAYVDAHLKDFDVSEDLTLDLTPTTHYDVVSRQPLFGFSVGLVAKKETPKSFLSQ